MNRKAYGTLLSVVFLAFSLLTGCGSSSPKTATPTVAITATSGSGQTAVIGKAFANTLVATVTTNGTPTSGITVTFSAPSAGASGAFAGGANTATTNANGRATSPVFTANATAGGPYMVSATAQGVATPANFSLTNTAAAVPTIAAVSGSGQSATVNTPFANQLVVKITTNGAPDANVVVTFTPPSSGASGTFAGGVNTATTDANGIASSPVFTANATAGGPYTVYATAPGVATQANLSLTNTAVPPTNYAFYMSGQDNLPLASYGNTNYLALAGAITVDNATGNVLGGEQDYNDANSGVAGDTSTDTITGGSLTVDSTTGMGTLTLITGNTSIGLAGTETFAVQFVNKSHALIMQYDGTATSSGSLDVQMLPSTLNGGYSFTCSGVDPSYSPAAFGGVFSISGTAITSGVFDYNDAAVGTGTDIPFTATVSAADSFGRGTIVSTQLNYGGNPIAFVYYIVGPEVIRIIDVDTADAAVGSAFGQGTSTVTNASLGSSVLALAGTYFSSFGVVGQFSADTTAATISGVGEDSEVDNGIQSGPASTFSGPYSFSGTSNGYGLLTITGGSGLGDVTSLGIYAIDPTLNMNDPNNPTGGGGALVLDLDSALPGGAGVLIPQTDTASSSFAGNYAVGWQDFNYYSGCGDCEFDMLSQGTMTAGALSLGGPVSDPFLTLGLGGAGLYSASTFTGTPLADTLNTGRYSMLATDSNSLAATIDGTTGTFDLVMYQANGEQLFWLNFDTSLTSVFVGPFEYQAPGGLTGLPAAKKPVKRTRQKR